ncbi:MAG: acylphosphatase [Thermoleophilia bacterium]
MSLKRAHVHISGRVQGVFFRAWVLDDARRLGLAGWVRNRFDGSVEAVFEGTPESVELMVKKCHEGPDHARVDTVLDDYSEAAEGLAGFEVRSSA